MPSAALVCSTAWRNASTVAALAPADHASNRQRLAELLPAAAAALDPQNTDIQTQIGISHLAAGDNQAAIAELSKAAAMDAGEHRADVLLIMTLLDLKEFDKALAAIDALGRKLPQNAMLQAMRGNAYLGKSDPATARKYFEEALSITPTFYPAAMALAQLDLADALAAQGHTVDNRKIELEHPIKTIGQHAVPVRLHPDVIAEVRVTVVAE